MNDPVALVFIFALYPFLWFGLLHLIARMGGWSRLAAEYRLHGAFDGFCRRFLSGQLLGGPFGGMPCSYRSCLTLGSNSHGLFLSTLALGRPGHPPLFIPWRDITATVERRFLFTYVTFAFTRVPPLRLRVGQCAARRIISEAGTYEANVLEPAK